MLLTADEACMISSRIRLIVKNMGFDERMKKAVEALKIFTFEDARSIIKEGENPANLDNFDIVNRTRNTVQMTREMTTSNGCHVTLIFPQDSISARRTKKKTGKVECRQINIILLVSF